LTCFAFSIKVSLESLSLSDLDFAEHFGHFLPAKKLFGDIRNSPCSGQIIQTLFLAVV